MLKGSPSWDSAAFLATMMLIDEKFDRKVATADLDAVTTAADVLALANLKDPKGWKP